MWTKQACEGMTARKAIVKGAQLFRDTYASAVLGRDGHLVVGYVLTIDDDAEFAVKLADYDRIEGYNAEDPSKGLYDRAVVVASFIDDDGKETGKVLETYMYHRKEIDETQPVPNGDWLQRDRSKDAETCVIF